MFCPLCGNQMREIDRDKYGNATYRCDECEQDFDFLSTEGAKVLSWE